MDNLTHTLAGLAVGEVIDRLLPDAQSEEHGKLRRKLILISSVAANNFPDLDFLLNPLLPEPLDYLLLHRGHTHTLLFLAPQGALIFLALWLVWPMARTCLRQDSSVRSGVVVSIILGLLLHISFDYLNSYGVHPFHPFDSRWYYGDMVFIIEPILWITLGCAFFMTLERKWLKGLCLFGVFSIPLYFTISGYLPWVAFNGLFFLGLALCVLTKFSPRKSPRVFIISLALSLLFVLQQNLVSDAAKDEVTRSLLEKNPDSPILDIALSPFPSNPFCWAFNSVSTDASKKKFFIHRGVVAPFPEHVQVKDCSLKLLGGNELVEKEKGIGWLKGYEGSISELKALVNTNCYLAAWLRFARIPYIDSGVATDLRFSRGILLENFTTLKFSRFTDEACPSTVPKWTHPRQDLLD